MNLSDVFIDSKKTLGPKLLLVNVHPVYEYTNGKKSDTISGYKYEICLPTRQFEKIAVKILGEQKIQKPQDGYVEVELIDLELFIYWMGGSYHIGARASDIKEAISK